MMSMLDTASIMFGPRHEHPGIKIAGQRSECTLHFYLAVGAADDHVAATIPTYIPKEPDLGLVGYCKYVWGMSVYAFT